MTNGKRLVFKSCEPFNMFLNLTNRQEWLPMLDKFRTFEREIRCSLSNHVVLTFLNKNNENYGFAV